MASKTYALIGEKLGHSMSPAIHFQMLDMIDVDGVYGLLEVAKENVPKIVDSLKVLGVAGANVTVPYKQAIMPYLDEIDPDAQAIGAINTIAFKDGRAIGYNTDCYGFMTMLKVAEIDVKDKDCVLVGGGGAGFAIITAFKNLGAKSIKVFDMNEEQLAKVKAQFPFVETYNFLLNKEECKGDVLANATPVGMYPKCDASILTKVELEAGGFEAVADAVYNPLETKLVSYAKELGMKSCAGLWMLVYQAMRSEEIWQDMEIPTQYAVPIHTKLKKNFV